jgi:oligopeptide transport system substrate-binding protein
MGHKGLGIDITRQNQAASVPTVSKRSGDYPIGRSASAGDCLDPSTVLVLMAGDSGNHLPRRRKADYDGSCAEANRTSDHAQRDALYPPCEDIIAAESPIAPIDFYTRNNLRRPAVKGGSGNLPDNHPLQGVCLDPAATVK